MRLCLCFRHCSVTLTDCFLLYSGQHFPYIALFGGKNCSFWRRKMILHNHASCFVWLLHFPTASRHYCHLADSWIAFFKKAIQRSFFLVLNLQLSRDLWKPIVWVFSKDYCYLIFSKYLYFAKANRCKIFVKLALKFVVAATFTTDLAPVFHEPGVEKLSTHVNWFLQFFAMLQVSLWLCRLILVTALRNCRVNFASDLSRRL